MRDTNKKDRHEIATRTREFIRSEPSAKSRKKNPREREKKKKVVTNLNPTDRSRIPNQRGIQEAAKEEKKSNYIERKGKGWSAHRRWGRGRPRGCWR